MTVTDDQKRAALKAAGWRRASRTDCNQEHHEYWYQPLEPGYVRDYSLNEAFRFLVRAREREARKKVNEALPGGVRGRFTTALTRRGKKATDGADS